MNGTRRRRVRIGLGAMAVLAAAAIAGCGQRTPTRITQKWDAAALQMPPGVAAQELPDRDSRGAQLLQRYCSGCHGVPSPASHSAEDWVPTLRRMYLRMEHLAAMGSMHGMMGNRRSPMMSGSIALPSVGEQDEILAYLRAHALRSIEVKDVRDTADPGAGLFVRICSRCHALPDPAQHTASQWPQVVERMRRNMQRMNARGIDDAQAHEISSYLQRVVGAGAR